MTLRSTSLSAWLIHAALALPWVVAAVSLSIEATTGEANCPIGGAAVPYVITAAGLLFTRRWWLLAVAIGGALASAVAGYAAGVCYWDTGSPDFGIAAAAHQVQNIAIPVGLLTCLLALIIGVVEIVAARRRAAVEVPIPDQEWHLR